uniref:G-protein coupled receptors family 1 profile domain-containing protein n=1 Tax=Leptobrachium leishanense TaxID=445787 RepID=A0A8C5Q2P7_9ANUR
MAHRNTSRLFYPSQHLDHHTDIEDIIASQNIISRVMHSYFGILVPLGLLSGMVSIGIIIWNKVKQQALGHLDFYLLTLAITDLTIILYSFTAITRPDYMEISNLSCGALASLFNLNYFYSQSLLILMLLLLIFGNKPNTNSLMTKASKHRIMSVCFTLLLSLVLSLLTAALIGTTGELNDKTNCQLDPLNSTPEYDFVKFSFGFCLPSLLVLILLVILVVQLQSGNSGIKQKVQDEGVVLLDISVMFLCRLFYNVMLLRRTLLKLQNLYLYPREELILNIAEIVLFSGSCVSLMFTLTLHKPCRLGVWKALQFIKKKCVGTHGTETPERLEIK